jgi:hypothetical protein
MIKKFDPPFLLNSQHSFIEDKIKNFSSNLFSNKIYGFFLSLLFNTYLIFCILRNKNLITIFIEFFVFFLIKYIIEVNIFKQKM